ncbi:MAG: PASTA domain-containing protein, partial [Acidobacteria bacterium]|nr:PASTA domain-containing protein [Acidobacteriota bacterium]
EILALANQPTFNPNRYADAPAEVLRNRAVSAAYEPGSTFKIITVAAALEEKLASPDDRIDCQMGSIVLAGHAIRDHQPFGLLSVQEIFQYSSDVGAIKLALRVGNEGLYRNLRTFGFGSPTGIELPGEASGLTKPPERWSKISIGAIAMGQEIGVTSLQMVTAASAVANGGWLVRPRIIRQGESGNLPGEMATPNPSRESLPRLSRAQSREAKSRGERADRRRILSPETAAELQRMMDQVVIAGTGKMAQPEGYTAAGKTGTAQKIDPQTGRYSMADFVASFVGFAPADSPQLTILVVLDSPRGQYHGGDVAAPVFKRIAEQVLAYRNLPAMLPRFDFVQRPELAVGEKPSVVMASRKEPTLPLSEELPDSYPTRLLSLDADAVVPNFLGKTVRAVTEESLAGNLAVRLIGSGIAYNQNPLPGTPLPEGQKVRIWFRMGEVEGAKLPLPTQTPANHPEADSVRSISASPSRPASG